MSATQKAVQRYIKRPIWDRPLRSVIIAAILLFFLLRIALATGHGEAAAHKEHGEEHSVKQTETPSPKRKVSRSEPSRFEKTLGFFSHLFHDFLAKVDQLRNLDETNELLRKRVAALETENGNLQRDNTACYETARAKGIKAQAKEEGGVETARTIASLKLADEKLLSHPPEVIFQRALKSFASNDFETAGKAFAFLVETPEHEAFQNARTFYLAGVSLFKVGTYRRAKIYFQHAMLNARGNDVSYAPRALGWIALCHAKLGDKVGEQRVVQELIQKYPKSREARRLNRQLTKDTDA